MGKGTPVALSVRLHGNIEKSYEGDYDIAGTRGQSLSLEGFRVDRAPLPNITIRYHAYIRDVGDVPAVHVGEWVGFHGKELMAFSASLEGPDAHKVEGFFFTPSYPHHQQPFIFCSTYFVTWHI